MQKQTATRTGKLPLRAASKEDIFSTTYLLPSVRDIFTPTARQAASTSATLVQPQQNFPPAPTLAVVEATSAQDTTLGSVGIAHYFVSESQRVVMDVRSITKTLPLGREHIDILKGISFQIRSGELVAIVGPSGSGKSTLLGIIAGLDNPTSGQVLIDGIDITRLPEGDLSQVRNQKIGMVFQAFNLIPTLTALENVEAPLQVGKRKGSHTARAKELLTLVGLGHRLHHRPSQLSGGEQQRIAIARALATDPPIVIADEPTGNLDARNGENILALIAHLRDQTGKTFIIATHDSAIAAHADHAIRIVDGLIAELDTTGGRITQ